MNELPTETRRALVTGATGFIGSNLVRRLVGDGWDVHAIVRRESDTDVLASIRDHLTTHVHDGTTEGMLRLVAEAKPDIVFHLASLFLAQHKTDDVEALVRSNLLFSTQLAEAMAANGVRYLVNTGTSWQHYQNEDYNPVNLYAATKQAFEAILAFYIEAHDLKVVTLALFDTYGPNDPRRKLIHLLWRTALSQTPLKMSPGEQIVDLVHIDDVVEAFLTAASHVRTQKTSHECFGISSEHPMRLKDLVGAFEEATHCTLPIIWGGLPYRPREVMIPWTDFPRLPGWRAKISFGTGIVQTRPRLPT